MVLACAALIVSVASVGVAVPQTIAANNQVRIAQEQIRELQNQFIQGGPIVTVSSTLQVEMGDASAELEPGDVTYTDSEAPIVSTAMMNKYSAIYFHVIVANNGRSPTTIQSVRLETASGYYTPAESTQRDGYIIYCGYEPPKDCVKELPHGLGPGETYRVSFPITRNLHALITGDNIASNGLKIRVNAVGILQQPLQYISNVKVAK